MLDVNRPISKFMEMIGGQTLPSDLRNFSGLVNSFLRLEQNVNANHNQDYRPKYAQ